MVSLFTLLIWLPGRAIQFRFPDIDPSVQFSLSDAAPILTPRGEPHPRFLRLADLMEEVLGRSTDSLISRPEVLAVLPTPGPPTDGEPNGLIGPAMTCRDAVDIRDLGCAVEVEGLGLRKTDSAVVVGTIQWTAERIKPDFFIMRINTAPGPAASARAEPLMPEKKVSASTLV